tara:strand:- start:34653 stop:37091 length:2439 start_codon:yes stop_codon:yes gene_type:complete
MKIKQLIPYAIAILIFLIATLVYFNPVLKGKQLGQSDITQFRGMVKEINDYRAKNDKEPYWTGASFSGMPAYQISAYYPYDFVRGIDKALRFLPRPADYTFLYFLSFFVLMMALKVEWRLAVFGALAFGFSTYMIIIFIPGHNSKALAIGYMPLVLAGFLWVFQKRYLLGFLVTTLAMALEIHANHIQMTYYLGFCLLILGIVELIEAVKNKTIPGFAKQAGILLLAVVLGLGMNSTRLMATKEYAAYSTRGKSELTINPDGTPKENTSSGLDKGYITQYSYAKLETFNLFVPRFMGGGTTETLDEDSELYQVMQSNFGKKGADYFTQQALTYWGDQPIVEAPAYIGAVVFFLFFLGIFLVNNKLKRWLVAATIFSIVLSWGRNFDVVTNFFIDYVPLYNKFRAVSSIQVIAELCVPILAVLGLQQFFSKEISSEQKLEALKKAGMYFGGLVIVGFALAHFTSTFEGIRDSNYTDMEKQYQITGVLDAVIADRKAMLFNDTLRSLILAAIVFVILWFKEKKTLKPQFAIIGLIAFCLIDLIGINLNYLSQDDFKTARKVEKPFTASRIDKEILKDTSHYRVANLTVNILEDGTTSYFHQSLGGYHAAKMGRYSELFDYQVSKNNFEVLHMLNAKYLIVPGQKGEPQLQLNDQANGNAWFVSELKKVQSADEEIIALDSLNSKQTAVIDISKIAETLPSLDRKDSVSSIELVKHEVTELHYQTSSTTDQFAVFSEIFYKDGWNAYLDGKLVPHYRVNYVLRGMPIPAGKHEVVFKFEPKVIQLGSMVSLSSYVILILLVGVGFYLQRKNKLSS